MRVLKLWIAAFWLAGVLSLVTAAQEAGPSIETPSKVSIVPGNSQLLAPGKPVHFMLMFDPAPRGYGGGAIHTRFRLVAPATVRGPWEGNLREVNQSTALVEGKAAYDISFPITRSMLPGTWKLVDVTLGNGDQGPIPFPDNVAFEVLEAPFPTKATVSAAKSQRLDTGQSFDFDLRFETAQDGWESGRIVYKFEMVGALTPPSDRLTSDQLFVEGQTRLVDGQSDYKLSLPVDGSMGSGTWKLVELSLGEQGQIDVPVSGSVAFEVGNAAVLALQVHAPKSVRAGERIVFTASVVRYPEEPGQPCVFMLSGHLRQGSLNGQTNPSAKSVSVNSVTLDPSRKTYEMSGYFLPDLPGGSWQGWIDVSAKPSPELPGRQQNQFLEQHVCRPPRADGNLRFAFDVEPAVGLVRPTSVAVIVNPSQIELLRGEAKHLRAVADDLRAQLRAKNEAANRILLKSALRRAKDELDRTEGAFAEKGEEGPGPVNSRVVSKFFDGIRLNYDAALQSLSAGSAMEAQAGPRLERVNAVKGGLPPRLDPVSEAALASISYNVELYLAAASSESLTFPLRVESDPEGAAIWIRKLGDTEFVRYDELTNSELVLDIATWFFKLQLPGYADWCGRFEGAKDKRTVLNAHLSSTGTCP